MTKEFSQFDFDNRQLQRDFLADWWSERKLFIGDRTSGKTTMLLLEAERFLRNNFSVCYFAPSLQKTKEFNKVFNHTFNQHFTGDTISSIPNLRGRKYDVILIDEFPRKNDNNDLINQVLMNSPHFIRASSNIGGTHPKNYRDIFDSVYHVADY